MLYSQGARNLVGSRGSCARAAEMQTSNEVRTEDWPAFSMYTIRERERERDEKELVIFCLGIVHYNVQ